MEKIEKIGKKKKKIKKQTNVDNIKLDNIMSRPGIDLIINASLALNASRARRRKRIFFVDHSLSDAGGLLSKQQILRFLFIAIIITVLVLSSIVCMCISQAIIDSNYECILSSGLRIRKESSHPALFEIDLSEKHLSPCLYCFRLKF